MIVEIGSTVTFELELLTDDLPWTGATATIALRRKADDYFLDWNDDTFKASGWTTKNAAMTEVTGVDEMEGIYRKSWDSSAVVTDYTEVEAIYHATEGADEYWAREDVSFREDVIAEKVLLNKLVVDVPTSALKLYSRNGLNVIATWPLLDKGGDPIASDIGSPVSRGVKS